jgi:hypothetical protein
MTVRLSVADTIYLLSGERSGSVDIFCDVIWNNNSWKQISTVVDIAVLGIIIHVQVIGKLDDVISR